MGSYSFLYLQLFFGILTLATIVFFVKACGSGKKQVSIILGLWIIFQGILSYNEFYFDTFSFPPRFALLLAPNLLGIILLFTTKGGRKFINNLNPITLTYLHSIRIPVEIGLYWLYCFKLIPELMTFEGRNFDIISGITAPFIAYYGYVKHKINRKLLLVWNIICLGLLINIVTHAILSVPTNFQQFAFDQPNLAILSFPFSWLASCIVPLVLLSHLVCIKRLLKRN